MYCVLTGASIITSQAGGW